MVSTKQTPGKGEEVQFHHVAARGAKRKLHQRQALGFIFQNVSTLARESLVLLFVVYVTSACASRDTQVLELNSLKQTDAECKDILDLVASENDYSAVSKATVDSMTKRLDARLKPANVAVAIATTDGDAESESRAAATALVAELRKKQEMLNALSAIVKATSSSDSVDWAMLPIALAEAMALGARLAVVARVKLLKRAARDLLERCAYDDLIKCVVGGDCLGVGRGGMCPTHKLVSFPNCGDLNIPSQSGCEGTQEGRGFPTCSGI